MIYIGIDLSLNSTGISVYFSKSNRYKFFCYFIDNKKYSKREIKNFEELKKCNVNIKHINYNFNAENKNFNEILNIKLLISSIANIIKKYKRKDNIIVGIEGISYNSTGNKFTLMSNLNFLLKYELIKNKIKYIEIAPLKIKRYVLSKINENLDIKKNKKLLFIDAFSIYRNGTIENNKFYSSIKENNVYIKNKPIDDIIDSFWVLEYIKENYKEEI